MKIYDVAVIFGGISNENEISVITGTMACNVLKKGGKSVLPVYLTRGGKMLAGEELADISRFKGEGYQSAAEAAVVNGGVCLFGKRGKIKRRVQVKCVLNCCHGGSGEGGGVAGLCAVNNLPLASAGLFESAACLDKYFTKILLKGLGVNALPYVYLRDMQGATAAEELGYPVIVKPCTLGSSIGIVRANNGQELHAALSAAFAYDSGVLVEKYVENRREINCAAYYDKGDVVTSDCEEVFGTGALLSFDDKYAGGGKRTFPADLPPSVAREIKRTTATVYAALNMRGIVRFDYLLSGKQVYLSEVNTVPGSLSYYLLSAGFADFYKVLCAVIDQAEADYAISAGKLVVATGILNNIAPNACKLK